MDMSSRPTIAAQPDDPRGRIVAALRWRAEGVSSELSAGSRETPAFAGDHQGIGVLSHETPARAGDRDTAADPIANPQEAPACAGARVPSLTTLITALPGDHTRAPQTEFTLARQVLFLENLSITGSVRSAVASAGVSHQTAYRARRGTGAFRTAWDAALVVARANADAVLASRAIDGVTEEVRYHGEVVGTRTRYSDRLLLAHLGRLDRLAEAPDATAFADDFEGALARFGRGEGIVASTTTSVRPEPVGCEAQPEAERRGATVLRQAKHERGWGGADTPEYSSPEPCNTRSKSNSPDDVYDVDWEDEAAAEAELARIEAAMAAERPWDAPRFDADDPGGLIADVQHEAFVRGVPRWWLVLPPAPSGGGGGWRYADDADAGETAAAEDEGEDAAPEREGAVIDDENAKAVGGEIAAGSAQRETALPQDGPGLVPQAEPHTEAADAGEPALETAAAPGTTPEPDPAPVKHAACSFPLHGRRYAYA